MRLTIEIDAFLSAKRARKQAKKTKKTWQRKIRAQRRYSEIDSAFGISSKILKMLSEHFSGPTVMHQGHLVIPIPEKFSTIENPEFVIALLGQFAKTMQENRARGINLDHSNLRTYDLAANGLLDIIAVELEREDWKRRRKIKWRGVYPSDPHIRRFIQALGIVKHLDILHEAPKPKEASVLRVFDVRNRHYYRSSNPNRADYKTKVVQQFAEHINSCLCDHGRELTKLARHKLCEYTGEILDNAEEHAGMLDWTIQGYLDNSRDVPFCEIAIFNFGTTIAGTLDALSRTSYTWKQIAPYLLHHRRRNMFQKSWAEHDLLTLIALQGHVSSKNTSPSDTRGNGTVDLIEFFQKVHSECNGSGDGLAKMAILSGSTHILFDGTYRLMGQSDGRKMIAFNKQNDLEFPPDQKYVKRLNGVYFPGTVISMRFPLSSTSTKEAVAKENGRPHDD